ncbi:MAG: ribosomal-processing cysteine protease Prp [Clostridiaceae bacterium]
MITVTMKRSDGGITGFTYEGHAGYADHGQDIVCSAVTAQLMMTYNGLETVLGIPLDLDMASDGGYFSFSLKDPAEANVVKAQVLMETLKLGLLAIQTQYEENITLIEEEV